MNEYINKYRLLELIPSPTDADEADYFNEICDCIANLDTIIIDNEWQTGNPPKSGNYLVVEHFNIIRMAEYHIDDNPNYTGWYNLNGCGIDDNVITHWMDLPNLPNRKE